MRAGWYISGAGHLAFFLALLFGGIFSEDHIPDVTLAEVSLVSEAELAALTPPAVAPATQTDAPEAAPPAEDRPPEPPSRPEAPTRPEPQPVEVPETPAEPDVEAPEPVQNAVIVDTAPPLELAPTEQDGTSLERDAVAAPAPRVAPVPQVAPPPDAETAPEVVEDRAPDPELEPQPEPEPEKPAAPEQASDRIVTEAEQAKEYAPASSKRPRSRPPKPVRTAETPRETAPETPRETAPEEPKTDPMADAVAAAVAEANQPAPTEAPVRSGPPLTGGEKDALRVAVGGCWNVGSLSTEAMATTVIVGVEMEQSGKPVTESIKLVSFSGGSEGAARQAFEAARRAIIRCGAKGFPLPVEKYAEWRDIEMTFNPEGMQFR